LRYLILGAGALGSVFGGLLQLAGHSVSFVGRGAHLEALRARGLSLTGIWGEHGPLKVAATDDPASLTETFDAILLCVKAYDTAATLKSVRHLIGPETLVVSIQNGLGNWEAIADQVGWQRTVGSRVIFGAEVASPGTAKVTVYADKVLVGSPKQAIEPARLERLAADFAQAGIPSELSPLIERFIWRKVLYNASLNPLGAILHCPYGELAGHPEILATMQAIIAEIFAVAAARQVDLGFVSPQAYYRHLLEVELPPTRAHRASMLQDLERGRRTEIDSLNGAIARYGAELGLPTPVNATIAALIRALETQHVRPTT
jgi:2-dehydropantoate 2-reductase